MILNNVSDICLIAPTENLAIKARNIISERNENIDVYVSDLDDAKRLCEKLIKSGAKILISRKGTKALIESYFNIEVVGINTILSDYIELFRSINNGSGIIAFFSYEKFTDDVRTMVELLNIDARYYRFSNNSECEKCVRDAINDGAVLGIGGQLLINMHINII